MSAKLLEAIQRRIQRRGIGFEYFIPCYVPCGSSAQNPELQEQVVLMFSSQATVEYSAMWHFCFISLFYCFVLFFYFIPLFNRGNALLIGSIGAHLTSLVSLALYMLEYPIHPVDCSFPNTFLDGLRSAVRQAGCDGKTTTVLFSVSAHNVTFIMMRWLLCPNEKQGVNGENWSWLRSPAAEDSTCY